MRASSIGAVALGLAVIATSAPGCAQIIGIDNPGTLGDGGGGGGETWQKMPTPMRDMAAITLPMGGLGVYVFGGRDAQGNASKAVRIFSLIDSARGAGWTSSFDMPTARYALGVTTGSNGGSSNMIAFGGFDQSGNGLAVVEVRAHDGTWTTGPPMPTPRGAFAYGGGPIVAGGAASENGSPIGSVDALASIGSQWQSLDPMPTPRAWLATGFLNGPGVAAIGGAPSSATTEILTFSDQSHSKWMSAPSMPTGRGHFAIAVGYTPSGGLNTVFAVGGSNSSGVLGALEQYDPNTNAWTQLQPMPTPRSGLAAAVTNYGGGNMPAHQVLVAIGGYDGTNVLDVVEVYDIDAKTWLR